jgi:uncharacterized protein
MLLACISDAQKRIAVALTKKYSGYRSIVINGKISFVENLEEKKYGMEAILNHLEDNPSIVKEKALRNENMYNNIAILKMNILSLTGKKGQ